ncbi:MAG: motility protein A [Firmicutes bacterium]|jgi:chemotaxis protein MotA|nr:motility protein A [Bacillota bacterium]
MKKLDIMTVVGMIVGFSLVFIGIKLEGDLGTFWNLAGIFITVGGSFGAVLISFRLTDIKAVYQVTKQVFVRRDDEDVISLNEKFFYLAQKARREGLLVLEDELDDIDDPFFRGGLQMVIDGFEPENIRHILNTEIASTESRHQLGQNIYKSWGAYAPAFGMLGTLIGLVVMLAHLDDPDAIGFGMAVALLTTFYGVLIANLLFLPMATKLEIYSNQEISRKEAIIESLLALQSGINPRLLQEQLKAYLSPAEKEEVEREAERGRQVIEEEEEVMLNV